MANGGYQMPDVEVRAVVPKPILGKIIRQFNQGFLCYNATYKCVNCHTSCNEFGDLVFFVMKALK